ncbi:hypothetical protein SAMN02787020_2559 [Brevundimonas sp. 374]|nr:hypothetical protein SAMN02787020_2559 [Brevundimonas sp. 374]
MVGADYACGWMPRCILLTPNNSHGQWLERIRSAVTEAGFEFVFVQDRSQSPMVGPDKRVILSCDPDFLAPSPDAHVTVIVTDVVSALRQTEVLTGASRHDGVVDASKLILKAIQFPATRRYYDSDEPEKLLEVLPDVWVERPAALALDRPTPIESAAAEAFGIYEVAGMAPGARATLRAPLFEFDERQTVNLDDVNLDTMGGPRWLLRGPGISLPAGEWQFSVTFGLNEDAARHRYALDYGDIEDLQRVEIHTKREGRFKITAVCSWIKSTKADLRIVLCEGSMGGQFRFDTAEVLCLKRF